MNKADLFKDLIVIVCVFLPPLALFNAEWMKKGKNKVALIVIDVLYAVVTLFTQNFVPCIFVLINIANMRRTINKEETDVKYLLRENGIIVSVAREKDYDRYGFNLKKFKFGEAMKNVVMSYLGIIIVSSVSTYAFSKMNLKLEQQEVVTVMSELPLSKFLLMIPLTVVFAPIVEEYVFRYLMFERAFKKKMGVFAAAMLSSLIFGMVHFNLRAFFLILWLGLFNCYLIEKKGYWYAVFNHMVFNGLTTLSLLLSKLVTIK